MTKLTDTQRFNASLALAGMVVVGLWLIKIYETLSGESLHTHGVFPRDIEHLGGILVAPLIHGSWSHLMTNSAALLVLLSSAVYGYPRACRFAIPAIYLGSGIGVWFFARSSFHFGASGLTFGLMFFTFFMGVVRWDPRASALSMLVFFLYGGMIWGIFPGRPEVSFEYHFFGAANGVLAALLLFRLDPPPQAKRYSWELEDEAANDRPGGENGEPYWMAGVEDPTALEGEDSSTRRHSD